MANVFPQNGDTDSGNNFSLWTSRKNISDYAHSGMHINADFSTNTLAVTEGYAFITYNDEDKVLKADANELTGYGFSDGVTNHVFLHSDFATDDNLTVVVNTTGSAPSGASLKIGEVDAAADTVTEINRKPVVEARSATIDSLNLQGNTTMKDGQKMFFGSNKDFSVSYTDSADVLKITDEINGQDIIEYTKGDNWRSDDSFILNDDKEAIFGTDRDFSFRYDSSTNSIKLRDNTNGNLLMEGRKSGRTVFHSDVEMSGEREIEFGGGSGYGLAYENSDDRLYLRDISNTANALQVSRGGGLRIYNTMNFSFNEAMNFVIDKRTSDPSNPSIGQLWYREDLD